MRRVALATGAAAVAMAGGVAFTVWTLERFATDLCAERDVNLDLTRDLLILGLERHPLREFTPMERAYREAYYRRAFARIEAGRC